MVRQQWRVMEGNGSCLEVSQNTPLDAQNIGLADEDHPETLWDHSHRKGANWCVNGCAFKLADRAEKQALIHLNLNKTTRLNPAAADSSLPRTRKKVKAYQSNKDFRHRKFQRGEQVRSCHSSKWCSTQSSHQSDA